MSRMQSTHSAAYKFFRARLVEARKAQGLTQVEVGKLLGIPHTRVSRMELGERSVSVVEAEAFAKLYKKPLSYFVPSRK